MVSVRGHLSSVVAASQRPTLCGKRGGMTEDGRRGVGGWDSGDVMGGADGE